ncbi:MAG: tetratricopeptide repeat protein [Alphaproteobacteria bacterium]|nr:tetratricopeptide repeat protein [Alphaproteobacteria bacterium]
MASHDVFVLGCLSKALVHAGKGAEALNVAQEMMRLDPAPPADSHLIYGRAYFANGDFDNAAEAFETVGRLKPVWRLNWRLWLASFYANAGRLDDARAIASKLVGNDPFLNIVSATIVEPYLRERDLEPFLDGLRKAGVPN